MVPTLTLHVTSRQVEEGYITWSEVELLLEYLARTYPAVVTHAVLEVRYISFCIFEILSDVRLAIENHASYDAFARRMAIFDSATFDIYVMDTI